MVPHHHLAHFYESDDAFADFLLTLAAAALRVSEACIVIATNPHRDLLWKQMQNRGLRQGDSAPGPGVYVPLDAAVTLQRFLVENRPDAQRFAETMETIIRSAGRGNRGRVCVFDEMGALLLLDGGPDATLRLEKLWNALADSESFLLLCSYPLAAIRVRNGRPLYSNICAQHSGICLP